MSWHVKQDHTLEYKYRHVVFVFLECDVNVCSEMVIAGVHHILENLMQIVFYSVFSVINNHI